LSSSVTDLEAMVRSRLHDAGVRYTPGRARVVRLIEAAGGPRSAAGLHDIVRDDVPLSSLYRTLTVLSDTGVLEKSHGTEGVALFELSEWLRGHHHHLVCVECGSVEDIDFDPVDEKLIGAVAERIADSKGFRARGHRIDVEGICGECVA
jgi:Fur family ferric uptake transcriptional regulator